MAVTRLRHTLVLIPAGSHAWTSDWDVFICLPEGSTYWFILLDVLGIYLLTLSSKSTLLQLFCIVGAWSTKYISQTHSACFLLNSGKKEPLFLSHTLSLLPVFPGSSWIPSVIQTSAVTALLCGPSSGQKNILHSPSTREVEPLEVWPWADNNSFSLWFPPVLELIVASTNTNLSVSLSPFYFSSSLAFLFSFQHP